jgi:transposase
MTVSAISSCAWYESAAPAAGIKPEALAHLVGWKMTLREYWARTLESYGHTVRLIAPHFVKPYVKTHKTDATDAEAICEAVNRPNMRFVPINTVATY